MKVPRALQRSFGIQIKCDAWEIRTGLLSISTVRARRFQQFNSARVEEKIGNSQIMKKSFAFIFAASILALAGCHNDHAITGARAVKLQSDALASIIASYPNLKPSDLSFVSMTNVVTHSRTEAIRVRYVLSVSPETGQRRTQGGGKSPTRARTFQVVMSTSGKVQSVSEVTDSAPDDSMTITRHGF